ncbi:uncharacterized protein BXZ73DRAFT_81460 [Epithele typhae]|uniref:uncharacterized protein n=1 Tax=Epithele typhae TaxID=378194 RepID=UPI0020086476|nr:uncharacterized protein BXZ73DRAFT_81460 [Epithele typhae]KAH9915027.1 hypothetical protein BXZ73DRAFT_81460 [Epithele typhae]
MSSAAQRPGRWPVPHIVLVYGGWKGACSRKSAAKVGREDLLAYFFEAHVWQPTAPGEAFKRDAHYDPEFGRKHELRATFHKTYGGADEGPVELTAVGWADMIDNVVQLELVPSETAVAGPASSSISPAA